MATKSCTPIYLNICATEALNKLPINYAYTYSQMYPRTGDGMYVSVFELSPTVNPNYNRDYLRGRIRGGLINGNQYCGKFYVSLYKSMKYGSDRICAYLDNGALDANNECLPIVVTPTWENPAFNYITDTIGWQRVQGAFTANGTETYITIGNFYSHANTHTTIFNAASSWPDAVYYIDDVSIIATTIKASAGNDTLVCLGDSLNLGRPNEVGLECNWYVAGNPTPFANTSNIWYKPSTTGTITLVQSMDNCMMSYDTVKVVVCNSTGVKDLNKAVSFIVYPNPTSGKLFFTADNLGLTNYDVKVYDLTGKQLFNQHYTDGIGVKSLQLNLSNGMYMMQLSNTENHVIYKQKIVIQQ